MRKGLSEDMECFDRLFGEVGIWSVDDGFEEGYAVDVGVSGVEIYGGGEYSEVEGETGSNLEG